ncbi:MAG: acyl-CoA dehydrogenase family protein [Pseudomonadota bacterium]
MIANGNKELKLLDRAAYEFSKKELAPEREENDQFPFRPFFNSILEKAYDLDFFHSILPETVGGIGQGMDSLCIILDNICREDSSLGGIIFTNSAAHEILLSANNTELLKNIVEGSDSAKNFLIAIPVFNDPSDVKPMLQAVKHNNGYFLSGTLDYLVLGGIAGHALLPAIIEGTENYSFFFVDLTEKNVKISPPVYSLGLHACPAVDVIINNTQAELVGQPEAGPVYYEKIVNRLSVAAAAMALGIMKGAFKEALDYTEKRYQGGRKIINWSEVRMMLAGMAIDIRNAEMIISRACQAMDRNEPGWEACSKSAAIHIQKAACSLTTDGIQAMGGVGYMKDFGQEKRFRDAKHLQALFGITPQKKLKYLKSIL